MAQETADAFAIAARAGAEGLLSQGVRAFALRQARYCGLARTRLQHLLIAAAMNLARLDAWLTEPEKLVPGQMMNVQVSDAKAREDIVAFLRSLSAR